MKGGFVLLLLLLFGAAIYMATHNQPDPSRCVDIIQCGGTK
jgi:uncharacterized membrane protein